MDTEYSEDELLNGLRLRDRKVLLFIYDEFFGMIWDLVKRNSGTIEDAQDLFQEALVVLFEKVHDQEFILTSKIKTFLYAVARNKWLMILRTSRNRGTSVVDTNALEIAQDPSIQKDLIRHEKNELMRRHLKSLGSDCQQILVMFFRGSSLREIGNKMGFTESYAKKRKFLCQKRLIEMVKADSRYPELKQS